jgi:UDP-GlcNAc:undecaprenyl-phosphate GlcNAc-1-phosphate transferase
VLAGVTISRLSMPWGSLVTLGALAIPVTLVWLVGVTNAFNLIDGLDGLAAGVAFLSATAIAVTAAKVDDKITVVLTVTLAGALLGFLRHNFSPATIFLGDSGSLFIGFLLAAAAIVWQQKATVAIAVVAPLVAFALPVTETAISVLRRLLRGQPLFVSDRQHIHHRLLTLGLSPRRAVLVLYAASALAALGCILIARGHNFVTAMVLVIFMGACWIGLRRLSYPEFVEVGRAFNRQRAVARGLLEDHAQRLRAAASLGELRQRLVDSASALELDEAALVFEAGDPPPASSDGLWRLTIPLNPANAGVDPRARLHLGRSPERLEPAIPLEDVGRELRAALEESLARVELEAVAATAWAPSAGRRV